MNNRRPLIDGITRRPTAEEQAFINGTLDSSELAENPKAAVLAPVSSVQGNTPLSTRIRSDIASALKRASLERQLSATEPNTVKDILEEAIEPWLKANGYLP